MIKAKIAEQEPYFMFSRRVRNLVPYIAGEQPRDQKYIKLNTNENPFPPAQAVLESLKNYDYTRLQLYPDPEFTALREKMGEIYNLHPENIFICNGSDEGLSFCFYAFFDRDLGNVLFPQFTYSFYPVYCDFYELEYKKIPLSADFSIDVNKYLEEKSSTGIIFPNPNAPTGIFLSTDKIAYLLENYASDRVVIIDEAYIDFGGESVLPLLARFKNLVIVRTFSKAFSLAGLRLGYIFADAELIATLFRVKDAFNSYPVNRLTQELACAALSDVDAFRQNNREIIRIRESFSSRLTALGWEVLPSQANFVFARKPGMPGSEVYSRLKEKGILVRNFRTAGIEDFLRISIGRQEDMEKLVETAATL